MTLDFDPRRATKKTTQITYFTPMSHTKISYDGNVEHALERNLPDYHATTNPSMNIHKHVVDSKMAELERNMPIISASTNQIRQGETNIGARDAHLRPTISAGSFEGSNSAPTMNRQEMGTLKESRKIKNARLVQWQTNGRR
jgi:hypothetical protein